MREQKTTVQINGKIYDASATQPNFRRHTVIHPQKTSVEGVVAAHHTTAPKAHPAIHRTPAPNQPKQLQKAKTLMRHSVKKPSAKTFTPRTVLSPVGDVAPLVVEGVTLMVEQDSAKRFSRAQHIPMSHSISRFGAPLKNISIRTETIPVRPAPLELPASPLYDANLKRQARHSASSPMPVRRDIAHQAMLTATGHTQRPVKHTKVRIHHKIARRLGIHHRVVSGGVAAVLFVVIGGYIAYVNVPNFALRVAAARAGVHASIPGYKPSGFAMAGPVQYEPGKVTLAFESGQDDRNFNVTQQTSNWNSETLKNSFVVPLDLPFQTYQDKGKTIYIYGNSNATWVDGGVWYQIIGNASLSSDQLIRIASSL